MITSQTEKKILAVVCLVLFFVMEYLSAMIGAGLTPENATLGVSLGLLIGIVVNPLLISLLFCFYMLFRISF